MNEKLRILIAALLVGLCCFPALAQEDDDEPVAEIHEVLVVTASRTEQRLHDVPAAITVLTSEQLETLPADDFGDLLRNVPGLNVIQIGTRDIQVSSRSATGSLSTGQLVMVDGRTVYLDFFGFVIWEYMQTNPNEIKQIEVVRGPGSSVWGANAMHGVINVISKSHRDLDGTYFTIGGGELDTAYANLTHAGVNGDFSYKLTGGYYQQDKPYARPTG
ncbi:MAG: TonB-dependent receptor plug domain-containing protein, partial [Thermoanaerobaculia bacterium]